MTDKITLDIIREVVNIGVGDAAAALSSLINSRVTINVPDVHILDTRKASDFVQQEIHALGVYIAQDFKDIFRGKALLFYTKESCHSLLQALTGKKAISSALTDTAMETLQEIGNILMVSCISTISNMLGDTVEFQIPDVTFEVSEGYFKNLIKNLGELDKTIIIRSQMKVKDRQIEGYIFIMIAFNDFMVLIQKLNAKMKKDKTDILKEA